MQAAFHNFVKFLGEFCEKSLLVILAAPLRETVFLHSIEKKCFAALIKCSLGLQPSSHFLNRVAVNHISCQLVGGLMVI